MWVVEGYGVAQAADEPSEKDDVKNTGKGQTGAAGKKKNADKKEIIVRSKNPYLKEIQKQSQVLSKTLDRYQVQNLVQIREAFGAIRAVRLVEKDVGKTAGLCAEKNPALAGSDEGRGFQSGKRRWMMR